MEKLVLVDRSEGTATVTLNRPDQLNALSSALRVALVEAFCLLKDDQNVRVVILTGKGRAFSAGLDLKELGQKGMRGDGDSGGNPDLQKALRGVGKPVIGAINGFAITGGFELALACDILVASESAKFADTHVRMGVVPGWGLSQRLSRLVGVSRAKQISFTGDYLSAEKAERWGLVNDVLAPDDLLPYCHKMAKSIQSGNAETLRSVHQLIDFGWEGTLADGLAQERTSNKIANADLSAKTLERNRLDVLERGRDQIS